MKRRIISLLIAVGFAFAVAAPAIAAAPPKRGVKSKFYDFGDQLIDGEIKKPTALYTDARQKAKFERLLKMKKSFLPAMFKTSKERIFK